MKSYAIALLFIIGLVMVSIIAVLVLEESSNQNQKWFNNLDNKNEKRLDEFGESIKNIERKLGQTDSRQWLEVGIYMPWSDWHGGFLAKMGTGVVCAVDGKIYWGNIVNMDVDHIEKEHEIAYALEQAEIWRDCALDGPSFCPKEYFEIKEKEKK